MTIIKDIYKSIFCKDYAPVWRQFAQEKGGTYLPIGNDRVQFPHKDFTITFDAYIHYVVVGGSSYEYEYTRGQVEFFCPDNFKLLITQQGLIDNVAKLFGMQDIQIGDKQFDKNFVIKSNDEPKTLLLLSNSSITKSLQDLKPVRFDITDGEGLWDEKPEAGNFMLYFVLKDKIKHIDQLNKMYSLFSDTIDTLIKLNSMKPIKARS
jgi:hypothetical protein